MRRKSLFCMFVVCLSSPIFAQNSLNDLNVIFKHDFENNTIGDYNVSEWNQDWLKPVWQSRQSTVDITQNTSDPANSSKTLQAYFPANSLGPDEGGTQWWTNLPKYEEIYVSYDIMFMPGFQFQHGGKLPSVYGGSEQSTRPTGYDGFTGGIMFKVDRPSFYIYYPDANIPEYGVTFEWGKHYTNTDFSPSKIQFEYTGGPVYFIPGVWHNMTYRMVLNTVKPEGGGNYDGILEAYFDGKLVTQISHILFRHTLDLGIDCLRMVTFFGGGTDDWRNPIDEWLKIDNVLLYTFKDGINVPRGNTLSPTDRTINYWRFFKVPNTTVPNAPDSLTESDQGTTSISLNWRDKSTNEYGFRLYRANSAGGDYTEIATLTSNVTSYTDIPLSPGTTYYYKVLAYNELGASGATPELTASTLNIKLPLPPSAPSDLTATLASDTSVSLLWTDNSSNETNFEIERSGPNDIKAITTFNVDSNVTGETNTGLEINSKYVYRIRAYNADGYSPYSNSVEINTPEFVPPSAPSMLKSKEFSDNSITIRWNDNSDNESGFRITRAIGTDPLKTVLMQVNANDTLFTDNHLEPNTTYIYSVNAVNQVGISAPSNVDVAFTLSVAETKRIKDGLIAYYNFGYDPSYIIHDLSGYGDPLNLTILQPNAVRWNNYNRLEVLSATSLVSTTPANKIISAVNKTGEITMECWIRPTEPDLASNSRIISLAMNNDEIGFVLDQDYMETGTEKVLNYSVRMQTESTGESGLPTISPSRNLSYLNLQHIAYVRDTLGNEKMFINGQKAAEGFRPSNFGTWNNNFHLELGNENDLNHPWKGTFYSLAIYNKALSISEISKNYDLGPCDTIKTIGKDFLLNVYPNPVTDIANVEVIPVDILEYLPETFIRILDIYGKVYYRKTIFNPNNQYFTTIDFTQYPTGIYFLQVISGKNQKSTKVIVQR